MKIILILIMFSLVLSCKFKHDTYCVNNTNWDNLDTCVDKALLNSYIKDFKLTDIEKFDNKLRYSLDLIQDTLRYRNEDCSQYYVNSIKFQDSIIFISIKHIDSYVYDFVINGNPPSIIGNISGKDRFYRISVPNRIIDENMYQ